MPAPYATPEDLNGVISPVPDNAALLILRASRAVDRALLTAVYDPDDSAVQEALKQATVEQVAGTQAGGDRTGLGVVQAPQAFTIGRLNVQRGSAPHQAPTTGGLVDQAWAVLQAAGLTGHPPQV